MSMQSIIGRLNQCIESATVQESEDDLDLDGLDESDLDLIMQLVEEELLEKAGGLPSKRLKNGNYQYMGVEGVWRTLGNGDRVFFGVNGKMYAGNRTKANQAAGSEYNPDDPDTKANMDDFVAKIKSGEANKEAKALRKIRYAEKREKKIKAIKDAIKTAPGGDLKRLHAHLKRFKSKSAKL